MLRVLFSRPSQPCHPQPPVPPEAARAARCFKMYSGRMRSSCFKYECPGGLHGLPGLHGLNGNGKPGPAGRAGNSDEKLLFSFFPGPAWLPGPVPASRNPGQPKKKKLAGRASWPDFFYKKAQRTRCSTLKWSHHHAGMTPQKKMFDKFRYFFIIFDKTLYKPIF